MVGQKPGPMSSVDCAREATRRVKWTRDQRKTALDLSLTNLKEIPLLDGVEFVDTVKLSNSKVQSIAPLRSLVGLKTLYLNGGQVSDLSIIATFGKLEALALGPCAIQDISFIEGLTALRYFSGASLEIQNLSSFKNLRKLEVLDIPFCSQLVDISDLLGLTEIRVLDISYSKVSDLSVLAGLVKLIDHVRGRYNSGLDVRECPLSDKTLRVFSKLDNPAHTIEIVNYVRRQKGLPEHHPNREVGNKTAGQATEQEPVDGVPSPFEFALSVAGKVTVTGNPADLPVLPLPSSAADFQRRLDTCRMGANDIISELENGRYQARQEYLKGLRRYSERLPQEAGDGNILLADREARILRSLFAADVDILSPPFAALLKVFLEDHMGLRAYYPEIAAFYHDVQEGRLTTPLPLDAVDAFVKEVLEYTPDVFEASVPKALGEAAEPLELPSARRESDEAVDKNQPEPPPDPLGEIEPYRARDLTIAGTLNSVWKTFLQGKEIYGAAKAWVAAAKALGPHAEEVLKWLREFISGGGSVH